MHSEARPGLSGSVSDKRLPATAELCSIFCTAGCGKGDKHHRISKWESPSNLLLYRSRDLQPWASILGYKTWKSIELNGAGVVCSKYRRALWRIYSKEN